MEDYIVINPTKLKDERAITNFFFKNRQYNAVNNVGQFIVMTHSKEKDMAILALVLSLAKADFDIS